MWTTADLYDANPHVQVFVGTMHVLGRHRAFRGVISTLKLHEDNQLVREASAEKGAGRVLVIDGGGSLRTALVGDRLAGRAAENGWAGIIVNGAIRDANAIDELSLGVRSLGTTPRRSSKNGFGERDVEVRFGHVVFTPGAYVYADRDGILVSPSVLDTTTE